jgi:hypothetical protein
MLVDEGQSGGAMSRLHHVYGRTLKAIQLCTMDNIPVNTEPSEERASVLKGFTMLRLDSGTKETHQHMLIEHTMASLSG